MRNVRSIALVALLGLLAACGAPAAPSPAASELASASAAAEPATPSAEATASASSSADAGESAAPSAQATQSAAPSASAGEVTRSLTGTTWQWIELSDPNQQVQIENPENYTLTLNDDGTVAIKADCSSAAGSFTAGADGSLTIIVGPSTLVACPPGSRGDEYTQKLGSAARYFFQDGNLFVELAADGGTLQFTPLALAGANSAAAAGLADTSWRWISLVDPTQDVQIENPENYTLAFAADGTVAIKADCNSASGVYVASADGTLEIAVGATTEVGCPEGSLGGEYLEQLGFVTRYFIQDGRLSLEMMADGGTLTFEPVP